MSYFKCLDSILIGSHDIPQEKGNIILIPKMEKADEDKLSDLLKITRIKAFLALSPLRPLKMLLLQKNEWPLK